MCVPCLCLCVFEVLGRADALIAQGVRACPQLPFGLGSTHRLSKSLKKMTSTVNKIGALAGAGDVKEVVASMSQIMQRKDKNKKDVEDQIPALEDAPATEMEQDAIQVVEQRRAKAPKRPVYVRKVNDSVTLAKLCEIVRFSLELPPGAARQKVCRSRFPEMKSNVLSKWTTKFFKYKLWEMPENLARKLTAVPKWWCQTMGLDCPSRGRQTVGGIPEEVAALVDRAVCEKTMGCTTATKRADPAQSLARLGRTMKAAMDDYNLRAEGAVAEIQQANTQAWATFVAAVHRQDGKLVTKRALAKAVVNLKSSVKKLPKVYKNCKIGHMNSRRLLAHFGNKRRRTNTQGNFLSYDDPRMIYSRQRFRELMASKQINYGLVLTHGFGWQVLLEVAYASIVFCEMLTKDIYIYCIYIYILRVWNLELDRIGVYIWWCI